VCTALAQTVATGIPASEAAPPDLDYAVDFWRTDRGLPHNTVNALLQTRDGYLWVGTAAGLARFDGFVFTVIGEEGAPELAGARITALLEDREGGLWVGTQDKGVVLIRKGEVQTFTRADGLLDLTVTSLAEDTSGTVWIGTQGGLHKWAGGRLELFDSDTLRPGEPIATVHAGRSGTLWITTRFEVYRLANGVVEPFHFEEMPQGRNADYVGVYEDRAGDLWTYGATFLLNLSQGRRFNYFRSLDPASSRVWTICEQGDGAFWIGTSGRGLFRFHDGRFDITGARDGLDQCDVRALHADHEGNVWIGTSGSGLARLRTRRWHVLGPAEGLVSTRVTALTADASGGLTLSTADAGLMRWNGERFEPLEAGAPLSYASNIRTLCSDAAGALWVGTWGAGLFRMTADRQWQFTTADGLKDDVVLALAAVEDQEAVWAGTLGGGLHRVSPTNVFSLTEADGLPGRAVVCLMSLADGQVVAGLDRGGILRWDGERLAPMPTPPELRGSVVNCLFEDDAGRLWVGTQGAGAFCRVNGSWVRVGVQQGLASDVIYQIIQDAAGHFWFQSNDGLCQVYVKELNDFLLGRKSAFPRVLSRRGEGTEGMRETIGSPRALRTAQGVLWFVVKDGLLSTDPVHARTAPPPKVMIEQVLVDGEPVFSSLLGGDVEQLRLGPGLRRLEVAFTAVSFTAPHQTRFRYKLEGFDLDWVQSEGTRSAAYGPLPSGRYRFRVIAANADGMWNEAGDTLSLVVVAPVWKAWWFMALSGMVGVGAIWAAVRYITFRRLRARLRLSEQKRAMERERTRIAQDMHDEIGSKLTRISFLSEAARYAVTEHGQDVPQVEAIATTSRELLQALDEIVWAVNPRNDNLEHLAGYLEQYAREYFHGTSLGCLIIVPDQLPKATLSAELRHNVFLAFEEALSNVLQHSGASRVRIEMGLQGDTFEILVADDGEGIQHKVEAGKPGHDGLRNMRERLRVVGGACQITSESGTGTAVHLRFPLTAGLSTTRPQAAGL